MRVGPEHEARRDPAGRDRWWAEWYGLAFGPAGDGTGGYSVVVLLPGQGRAFYLAALVRPGAPLVSVVDLAQGVPVQGLRLRAGNLWADHVCEDPLRQWTVVNETYAVALDDADEALGRAYGHAVPVAFDLEWYATAAPRAAEPDGYTVDGRVHGVVELREGRLALDDLPARHEHRWGPWPFPAGPGPRPAGPRAPARVEGPDGPVAWDAVLGPAGWWWGTAPGP